MIVKVTLGTTAPAVILTPCLQCCLLLFVVRKQRSRRAVRLLASRNALQGLSLCMGDSLICNMTQTWTNERAELDCSKSPFPNGDRLLKWPEHRDTVRPLKDPTLYLGMASRVLGRLYRSLKRTLLSRSSANKRKLKILIVANKNRLMVKALSDLKIPRAAIRRQSEPQPGKPPSPHRESSKALSRTHARR